MYKLNFKMFHEIVEAKGQMDDLFDQVRDRDDLANLLYDIVHRKTILPGVTMSYKKQVALLSVLMAGAVIETYGYLDFCLPRTAYACSIYREVEKLLKKKKDIWVYIYLDVHGKNVEMMNQEGETYSISPKTFDARKAGALSDRIGKNTMKENGLIL